MNDIVDNVVDDINGVTFIHQLVEYFDHDLFDKLSNETMYKIYTSWILHGKTPISIYNYLIRNCNIPENDQIEYIKRIEFSQWMYYLDFEN